MPFPFANLNFDLLCRLSELSTLIEWGKLQIAAPDAHIGSSKARKLHTVDNAAITYNDGKRCMYVNNQILDYVSDNDVYHCNGSLTINNMTEPLLLTLFCRKIADNVILRPKVICLTDCYVEKPLLDCLQSLLPRDNVKELKIEGVCKWDCEAILNAFPKLKVLDLLGFLNLGPWMSEIEKYGQQMPQILIHASCEFWRGDEIVAFLKTQRHDFELHLFYENGDDSSLERQAAVLKPILNSSDVGGPMTCCRVILYSPDKKYIFYLPSL